MQQAAGATTGDSGSTQTRAWTRGFVIHTCLAYLGPLSCVILLLSYPEALPTAYEPVTRNLEESLGFLALASHTLPTGPPRLGGFQAVGPSCIGLRLRGLRAPGPPPDYGP